MPYSPTTWVNGVAPALEAANLNNLETQHAQAIADGWSFADVAANGTLGGNSHNVASSVKDAVGQYTVTWDTDYATTGYFVHAAQINDEAGTKLSVSSKAVGSCQVRGYLAHTDSTDTDQAFQILAQGTYA